MKWLIIRTYFSDKIKEAVSTAEVIPLKDFKTHLGCILKAEALEQYKKRDKNPLNGLIWVIPKKLDFAFSKVTRLENIQNIQATIKDFRNIVNLSCQESDEDSD